MDNRNVSVFDIKVNASQAVESMQKYEAEIKALKDRQDELKDSTKTVGMTQKQVDEEYAKNAEKIKILNQRMAAQRKAIQNQIKANEENGRSLVAMRAELSNLVQEFDNLSEKERNGEAGDKLAKQIANLTKEIKGAEYATERYFRNVGNYPGRLDEAFGKVSEGFETMGDSAQAFGNKCGGPLGNVANGIKGINVAMKALWANPLLAGLGAIIGILMAVANAISKNEDLVNRLKVSMSVFEPILNGVANGMNWLAEKLVYCIENFDKIAVSVAHFISNFTPLGPILKLMGFDLEEMTKKAVKSLDQMGSKEKQITIDTIKLEKERRDFQVQSAKTELKIAELRNQLAKTDKKNYAERKRLLSEAVSLEEGLANKRKEFADREFDIAKRKAELAPNDKQANEELAQLEANKYKVQKEYNDKTRELNGQLTEFDKAQTEQMKAQAKEREEARKKELEEFTKWQEDLKKAHEKILKDRIDLLKLEIDNNEFYGRQKLNKQLELLLLERDAELANTELTEEMRLAIKVKYLKKAEEAEMQFNDETSRLHEEAIKKSNEYVLNQMKLENASELDIMKTRLAQTKQMYDQLNEEDADYAEKKQAIDLSVYEQEKAIKEKEKAVDDAKTQAIKSNYEKLADSASAMLSNDKNMARIQKAIALGKVAVSEGEAIAKAIADDKGDPYTKALRIASSVASIVASFATAISSINSAKFARGGYVSGAGTSTSDSIQARLSNGESVMNAKATSMYAPILSQLNQSAGGAPINAVGNGASANDNDFLAVQFAKAVATIQPIVSIEEFNRVASNVKVIESNAYFQ